MSIRHCSTVSRKLATKAKSDTASTPLLSRSAFATAVAGNLHIRRPLVGGRRDAATYSATAGSM